MVKIGILGAGPAGIFAALTAAKKGAKVDLFDHNSVIGKKLSITGSGRGNLTNLNITPERYASDSPSAVGKILSRIPPLTLLDQLEQLGIPTVVTDDGWVYPLSNTAANVVDILYFHLVESRVNIILGESVIDIIAKKNGGFHVTTNLQKSYDYQRLIIATGGKAHPEVGASVEILECLKRLGVEILPIFPALAPILTEPKPGRDLRGVRVDVESHLKDGERTLEKTIGNLIFTEWGLNGPAVMDLSHRIGRLADHDLTIELNYFYQESAPLAKILSDPSVSSIPVEIVLKSALPDRLIKALLHSVDVSTDWPIGKLNKKQRAKITECFTAHRFKVAGTRDFSYCQVSTGGVALNSVNPATLESRKIPGLFFAGEVLNLVGPCGGYNLHWAFSTGAISGGSAAEEVLPSDSPTKPKKMKTTTSNAPSKEPVSIKKRKEKRG